MANHLCGGGAAVAELRRLVTLALLPAAVAVGCRGPSGSPPSVAPPKPAPVVSAPAPAAMVLALPDVDSFVSGVTTGAAGYVRRTYTRRNARIEVTLARMAMSSQDYASWVRTSTASFPQAALDLPAAEANGFYQCTDGPPPSCDLLIQLRAGVHLEIRGGGTSSRDDVDALARGFPLAAFAARPAE
jgi:hypothetical protein